ncbi:hypothetical protein NMY22_g4904 [Coprinellus aureogranulatus]|nr:hypothetical protein NMY22_g4904 [Coprinellus aureogranulatus]
MPPKIIDLSKLSTQGDFTDALAHIDRRSCEPRGIADTFQCLSDTVPPSGQPTLIELRRAITCIQMLSKLVPHCNEDLILQLTVKNSLLKCHRGLSFWLDVTLSAHSGEAIRTGKNAIANHLFRCAELAKALLDIGCGDQACMDILLSPAFLRLILTKMLHACPRGDPARGSHILGLSGPENCQIMSLLLRLTAEDIFGTFIQRLEENQELAEWLAKDFLQKFHLCEETSRFFPIAPVVHNLCWLVDVSDKIIQGSKLLRPVFTRILTPRAITRCFKKLVNEFFEEDKPYLDDVHKQWGAEIVSATCVVVTRIVWDPAWAASSRLAQSQAYLDSEDSLATWKDTLRLIGLYAWHPDVCKKFASSWKARNNAVSTSGTNADQVEPLWIAFLGLALARCDDQSNPTHGPCDNLKCGGHWRSDGDKPTLKQCSACFSVGYCSVGCQREDWELFHRQECPVRVVSETPYTLKTRAFHVRCIREYRRKAGYESLTVKDLIIDYTCFPPELSTSEVEGNVEWGSREAHFRSMIAAEATDETQPLYRVARVLFPWNSAAAVQLSVLLRVQGDLISAKSSFAEVREPDVNDTNRYEFLEEVVQRLRRRRIAEHLFNAASIYNNDRTSVE